MTGTVWRTKWRALGVSGAALMVLSACGSAPSGDTESTSNGSAEGASAVYEKFATSKEPERTEELIKAAKAEGTLVLYGSPSVGEIGEAFSKKYGIELTFYEANVETAASKIEAEAEAGRHTADVLEGSAPTLLTMGQKDLLGRYESPLREKLPAEAKGEFWTGHRRQPLVAGYNTDKVSADEIPDDYLEFADPKWKGKISMDIGDYDWYMALATYYMDKGMSRDEVHEAFGKIASNARRADGHADQVGLLAAGQFGVTMSSTIHHLEQYKADGAPVSWGGSGSGDPTVQPMYMSYNGFGVLSAAPHPAVAALFLDFAVGPDGAKLARKERQLPVLPEANDPLEGIELATLDPEQYLKDSAKWAKEYDELIRNASS